MRRALERCRRLEVSTNGNAERQGRKRNAQCVILLTSGLVS